MENNTAAQMFDITTHAHIAMHGPFMGSETHVNWSHSVYQDEEEMTPHAFAEMVSDEVLHTVTFGVDEVWSASEVTHTLTWCHGHCPIVVAENS